MSSKELQQKLSIQFVGEEGVDAGGVSREWYQQLSKEIFNPNYALFKPSANSVTFQPNPTSFVNEHHLVFFQFVGKILAKALLDNMMLDAYFTRAFYKHILQQKLTIYDMEDIDPEFFKSLLFMLEHEGIIENLELTFTYEEDQFGIIKIQDLVKDGANILVTERNKQDYVQKLCFAKMAKGIEDQLKHFLQGFHQLIPSHLIKIFTHKELELMISGLPEIDRKI